ncbi:MAG TPA: FAD binding domain-containing protein [Candidatus Dormibacteraeota bacterium]|nr:FAD binding domain-containing protein [Candidatus Dormibacteraeota bacterium]
MIPAPLRYERPATIDEAVALLARHGEDARPLAGGQSLVPMLRFRLASPAVLVDLAGIPGLAAVGPADDGVAIGPLATHHQVGASGLLAGLPLFADAAHDLGDIQVRNRGTFVGALAHADPAADWAAVALAAGVTLHLTGPGGTRSTSMDGFSPSPFAPDVRPGELITLATVPSAGGDRRASAYVKLADGASGYALAGVAAVVTVEDGVVASARIAATGVAATPCRLPTAEAALAGRALDADSVASAAAAAADGIEALSDHAASADYRLHLLSVACRRALTSAWGRLDR